MGNVATAERWNLTKTDCYLRTVALPAEPSLHVVTHLANGCTYACFSYIPNPLTSHCIYGRKENDEVQATCALLYIEGNGFYSTRFILKLVIFTKSIY